LRAIRFAEPVHLWLLNRAGYWLVGPRPEDEWAFMYPERRDRSLAHRDTALWQALNDTGRETHEFTDPAGFFAFGWVSPFAKAKTAVSSPLRDNAWAVVGAVSAADIAQLIGGIRQRNTLIFSVGALLLAGLSIALADAIRRRALAESLAGARRRYEAMVQQLPIGVYQLDFDGRLLFANPAMQHALPRITGHSLRAGEPLLDCLQQPHWRQLREELERDGKVLNREVAIPGESSGTDWFEVTAVRNATEGGTIDGVIIDVTDRKLAALALEDDERRFRMLLEWAPDAVIVTDTEGGMVMTNVLVNTLLGYGREDLVGRNIEELIPFNYRRDDEPDGENTGATSGLCPVERGRRVLALARDGEAIPVEITFCPVHTVTEQLVMVIMRDVRERERIESELRILSEAVEHSPNGILITNTSGVIEYVNTMFCDMHGYRREEVIGKTPDILGTPETALATHLSLWQALKAGEVWRGEMRKLRKDGTLYWCMESTAPVRDHRGQVSHYVSILEDISERKFAAETIRRLAYYDTHTNLPNRRLFQERLARTIVEARREKRSFAVLYLDLDRFKEVNETLGHNAGDQLLKEAAQRFANCLREIDTVARLGGDEFAVLMIHLDNAGSAARVADKLVDTMRNPVLIGNRELVVTTSIGIALYPGDGENSEALIKAADVALYRAKSRGRGGFQFYSEEFSRNSLERLNMEARLRKALNREDFHLVYQPQFDTETDVPVGVEALIRWRDDTLGVVPPEKFIPLAEDAGLIIPIGEWVLHRACQDMQALVNGNFYLSVNLSPHQFCYDGMLPFLQDTLDATGMSARSLVMEITETTLMEARGEAVAVLQLLKDFGVQVSLDDFGTGYSSLNYLKRFPLDSLKIDKSFVSDIAENLDDRAIVEAIIALAHSLRLGVVAEGVETREQLHLLTELGCRKFQGYLFSQPLELDRLKTLLGSPGHH
jgi:diguanylate cyclase (GGDEF)-like protein/PAS domain S-box-containing protein